MKAKPLELAYTALARMAVAGGDGDAALEAAHQGLQAGVPAKLRAFTPALLAYAVKGQVEEAFQVCSETLLCLHYEKKPCLKSVLPNKQIQL